LTSAGEEPSLSDHAPKPGSDGRPGPGRGLHAGSALQAGNVPADRRPAAYRQTLDQLVMRELITELRTRSPVDKERLPAGKVLFDPVKGKIKDHLAQTRREKAVDDLVRGLKKTKAKIETYL
jgi:hypothetical protein